MSRRYEMTPVTNRLVSLGLRIAETKPDWAAWFKEARRPPYLSDVYPLEIDTCGLNFIFRKPSRFIVQLYRITPGSRYIFTSIEADTTTGDTMIWAQNKRELADYLVEIEEKFVPALERVLVLDIMADL